MKRIKRKYPDWLLAVFGISMILTILSSIITLILVFVDMNLAYFAFIFIGVGLLGLWFSLDRAEKYK